MSNDSLAQFWKKVESDAKLQRSVDGLFKPSGNRTVASGAAIVDLAAKHGFAFTADELREHLAAAGGWAELSEAELESVAGGSGRVELHVDSSRPGIVSLHSRIVLF